MISPDTARFWWRAIPKERPKGTGWRAVDESDFREREDRVTGRQSLTGPVPGWADDLLRVARSVFLADRLVRRDAAPDGWTRHFTLSLPVCEPDRWQEAAAPVLGPLLWQLTHDAWTFEFRQQPQRPTQVLFPGDDDRRAREVALFSGGLDSLSWAAQRAGDEKRGPLLLVTFADMKAQKRVQQPACAAVRALSRRLVRQITVPGQTPQAHGSSLERTVRSRALLSAALAVRAAAAEDVPVLHIPENGQLALSPPPSPGPGPDPSPALPTSTVHPWPLYHLNALIRAVAGTVRVKNPLLYDTNGQTCAATLAAGLGREDLERTLSCAATPPHRAGTGVVHCGLCYPCLVRRSGLLHANGADATPYGTAPWLLPADHARAGPWRALEQWLDGPELTAEDLVAYVPLPPGTHAEPLLDVVGKGREELRRLVRERDTLSRPSGV